MQPLLLAKNLLLPWQIKALPLPGKPAEEGEQNGWSKYKSHQESFSISSPARPDILAAFSPRLCAFYAPYVSGLCPLAARSPPRRLLEGASSLFSKK